MTTNTFLTGYNAIDKGDGAFGYFCFAMNILPLIIIAYLVTDRINKRWLKTS